MSSIYVIDAWRMAQEPQAIAEAVAIGQEIHDLFTEVSAEIKQACQDAAPLVEHAQQQCQHILDQITAETQRLAPILTQLRVIGQAVTS
ncbi:MAG: hypothetical protein ACRDTG_02055 [Pseudonocardiaceae bacterium]